MHPAVFLQIFNYRLSRTRRFIENSFGVMAATWKAFGAKIALQPTNVESVRLAVCALHNYLLATNQIAATNADNDNKAGSWRGMTNDAMGNLQRIARLAAENGRWVRYIYCTYFNIEGAVNCLFVNNFCWTFFEKINFCWPHKLH